MAVFHSLAAFVLGTAIGAAGRYRQRRGGSRTHVLRAIGTATFVDVGMHLNGNPGASQVLAGNAGWSLRTTD